jgi:hypothetical protein
VMGEGAATVCPRRLSDVARVLGGAVVFVLAVTAHSALALQSLARSLVVDRTVERRIRLRKGCTARPGHSCCISGFKYKVSAVRLS